jgi:hypothetical protein
VRQGYVIEKTGLPAMYRFRCSTLTLVEVESSTGREPEKCKNFGLVNTVLWEGRVNWLMTM